MLERVGLAWNVNRPDDAAVARRRAPGVETAVEGPLVAGSERRRSSSRLDAEVP
jgi:hypothetical protein